MTAVLLAYRRVLANRRVSALLLGEFVSSIGDWLYLVALLIIIYDRTQDAVLLGVVGAARVLPYVFLSIPAGILADRLDRRMILLVTDLIRGGLMLVLAWLVAIDGSIEAIVAVTILATCCSAFFGPSIGAYLPALVGDERDLGPANTAYATLENVAFICGPALAAIIIAAGSLVMAFLLNALTFAFVAAILWRLPSSRGGEPVAAAAGRTAEPGAGDGSAADDAAADGAAVHGIRVPVAAIMTLDVAESFVFGGLSVLTVVIAFDRLGIGDEGTGLLNAAIGVGGLIGALVSGALILRRRLAPPMLLGAFLLAGGVAAIGLSTNVLLVLAAFAICATGSLLVSIVATTLLQRIVPSRMLGRTLGVMETVSILAYAAGALLIPALSASLGIETLMLACGLIIGLSAIIAIPLLGPYAVQSLPDDPVRAALSRVAQFSGLTPDRLERAESRASVVNMVAGQVLIRQGEPADRFYVIADGSVEVTQVPDGGGDVRFLRQMGPDEAFGEIGLLSGVPRTATVTALSAGRLLAVDKADFLELVGNGPSLTFPLLDIHRGASMTGG